MTESDIYLILLILLIYSLFLLGYRVIHKSKLDEKQKNETITKEIAAKINTAVDDIKIKTKNRKRVKK